MKNKIKTFLEETFFPALPVTFLFIVGAYLFLTQLAEYGWK